MINITDKRARVLWQQEMDRQMQVLERPYIRKLTPLLNKQFRDAAEYVMHGMLDSTDFAIDKRQKEHLALLKEHYKRVATVFGKKSYKIIESGKFVFPPELKAPVDEYWKEINRWSETEAATKIRRIQKTTKGKIASIIKTGMGEQESHRDIAKRITKTSYSINPFRAQTIALTETHTASVRAVDTAVKSTRIEMEREWVSAHDMRTRTRGKGNIFEHLKAFPNGPDGERTSQDGKFTGTGEALSYPGDSSGSPGNVIRCRCCLLYHSVRRTEPIKPYEPQESFIPAQNLDEAQNRFEKIGIEYVSAPGRGQYKWTDEKLFLENILNPSLQELERLEREFPSFARLRDNPISNIEFYRGMKLSTGGWGQYTKEFKEIRLAMVDTAKEMKDSLLIGEKNFNISLNFRSILRHETGHHFQDIVLTNTERDSFLQLWESKGRIKQGVFSEDKASRWFKKNISGYAGTNQQEAFAECFSAYTSPKYKAGMLPKEIEEYFEKLIGKRKLPGVVVKPVSWKPVMTEAEANVWAKNSIFKDFVYHGTTNDNAQNIMKGGFSLNKIGKTTGNAGALGRGFYFSPEIKKPLIYAEKGTLLTAKINVKKLMSMDEFIARANKNDWWTKFDEHPKSASQVLRKEFMKEGFDGVLWESGKYRELVVFDPKKIVITAGVEQ